jgi:hypothetical protein
MSWFQRNNKIDEHDEPTEPVQRPPTWMKPTEALQQPQMMPPAGGSVQGRGSWQPVQPYQPSQGYPPAWQAPGQGQGYPYHQGQPGQQRPVGDIPAEEGVQERAPQRLRMGRRLVPMLVGLFFVIVQFLLLARFALKLMGMEGSSIWTELIISVSGLFVAPFAYVWTYVPIQLSTSVEVYTLVAVLGYGIFSRIVVRILKFALRK